MKSKIPSKIRFMIQDVIDLRRDKWIPRRNDSKPKLINEIENDAKNEAIEQSMARESYRPEKPRDRDRDHHRGDDNKFRGGDNKSRRKYLFLFYFDEMYLRILLSFITTFCNKIMDVFLND